MVADFDKKIKEQFFTKKLLFQALGAMFLAAVAILIYLDFKIYHEKKKLLSEVSSYQKQIEDIKKSNQNLKNEIANSGSKDYLEKIAYEQLNEQKPGEQEVIFVAPQQKQKAEAASQNSWTGWFSQAWNWLKSKF